MTKLIVACGGLVWAISGHTVAAQALRRACRPVMERQPTACVMAPREGATVQGPSVRVVLDAKNISIAPAAAGKAGAAHFHILLDTDVPAEGPIPADVPGIVHLGKGQKEWTLENVSPGGHRIIVVLGDNGHVPVARQKADTIHFSVAAKQ